MATTITIPRCSEDLSWPRRCVCCGGVDEVDIEVVVQDTVDHDRPLEEVLTAHVPHCLDCRDHSSMGFTPLQTLALVVLVCFTAGVGFLLTSGQAVTFATIGFVGIAAIIGIDYARVRRHMKANCPSARAAFRFLHPSGRDTSTVTFLNDSFAREFAALNGKGVYEP